MININEHDKCTAQKNVCRPASAASQTEAAAASPPSAPYTHGCIKAWVTSCLTDGQVWSQWVFNHALNAAATTYSVGTPEEEAVMRQVKQNMSVMQHILS